MSQPTIMQCPPKPEKLNTGLTAQDAEHFCLPTQKRLSKNVQETEQAINGDLKLHGKTLPSVKRSMHGLGSITALTGITLGRGLSSFFALIATTELWNTTTKTMNCGGQWSHSVSVVTLRGTM